MENISLELEEPVDNTVLLREKETQLVKIIQALEEIEKNDTWQYLKETIFDGIVESLKKRRDLEVEKKPLNGPLIHSINGQLEWAKKYSNLTSLASIYRLELSNVRKLLNGK